MPGNSAIQMRATLSAQVYDHLRLRIVTGKLAPGALIDDKDIAAQLHISRTPVREALKRLSDERLVDIVAQSGTRVSPIDPEEVRQAYLIRRALEMEGAGQAASRMNRTHARQLRD